MKSKKKLKIAPSVLSANFSCMEEGLDIINKSCAEWVHLDVMDGQFVPPITFGAQMVKSMRALSEKTFDVHLMIQTPGNQINNFAEAGADYLTVHYETEVHLDRLLHRIRETGMKPGVSLVPSTPVSLLKEVLPLVDLVLVMTVNPGFGGQKLIPSCLKKVEELVSFREKNKLDYLISVDGGINRNTISMAKKSGIDVAVAGSAFFSADDPIAEAAFFVSDEC